MNSENYLTDVDRYIDGVLSGQIIAGKWTRAAVQRHVDDLESGDMRGLWFDPDRAQHVIDFFAFLKHSKGRWAGQTIELEPWQQFILSCVFGWMTTDEETGEPVRRFRTAYLEVGRKNGKSTLAAGIGLYLLVADNEQGAEVYTAATKRDQARITHAESTRMVKASAALRRRLRIFRDNIHIAESASKYEPLGGDADSLDGLNVHGAIVDELHAHKSRDLWDVLATATGARLQPLMLAITTAGTDRHSICFQLHEYTERILERTIEADRHFGIIYALDDDDDPHDEGVWSKANPNLGVSTSLAAMRALSAQAKEMPANLNAFLRFYCSRWVAATSRWVNGERWAACGGSVNADGLRGRVCYAGLDLSTTTDITALALIFPPDDDDGDDLYRCLLRFWVPQEAIEPRSKRDRVPYDVWVRQGWIETTPGNVVDYDYILDAIDDDAARYDIRLVAYDPWGASKVANDLMDAGHEIAEFRQTIGNFSPAMKELQSVYLSGRLAHGNNPVLNWMAGNLVTWMDSNENIRPDKKNSREKIDGMVALIMALAVSLGDGEQTFESVYATRGILSL